MRSILRLFGILALSRIALPIDLQAQTRDQITLFADAAGVDCSVSDTVPCVIEIHIFYVGTTGSRGASFTAPTPECWNAVWLADNLDYPGIGSSHGDFLDIGYAGCIAPPIHIGRMAFLASGNGQACCSYPVRPSYFPTVASIDCSSVFGAIVEVEGGSVTINEMASCPCGPAVPVESATWGRVKALYR